MARSLICDILLASSLICLLAHLMVSSLTHVLQFDFGYMGLITDEVVDFSQGSYDWVVDDFSVWVGCSLTTNRFILQPFLLLF